MKANIHRDLKPQNIKASIDGKVKVLDFGLAKAMDPAAGTTSSASQLAKSPTLTLGQTMQGVILGTAAYMAPEQAVGGAIDRRADIWSFGVVLFEMLSGGRLFEGETVSHVLASVLKDTPDFSRLPAHTPPRIVRLIQRCLRKKPRERLQAIGDARIVLDEVLAGAADEPASATSPVPVLRTRPAWQIALVLIAVAAAGAFAAAAILGRKEPATTAPRTLSELPSPEGIEFQNPALSPDGTWLAMRARATSAASAQIWIRNLATGDVRPVAGTEHGAGPFWSPDGRALGYVDVNDHWLKRIDLEGGRSVRLAKLGTGVGCGATWGPSEIVFCATPTYSLHRVAPSGGEGSELTHPGKGEGHYAPWFLRDGKRFLFVSYKDGGGSITAAARPF